MQNGAAAKLVTDFKVLIDDAEGLAKASATRAGERIGDLRQRLRNRLEEGKNTLTTGDQSWIEKAKETKRQAESYLSENAWTALLIAIGVGAFFGLLLHRNNPSRRSHEEKREESL